MIILLVVCVVFVVLIISKNTGNTSTNSTTDIKQPIVDKDLEIDKPISLKETKIPPEKTIANNKVEKKTYDWDEILKLKNKDFVFKCLYILKENDKKEDIEKLTNPDFCKNCFDMNFAILQEITFPLTDEKIFMDNSGYRRYYPDWITLFDKNYIVCNDWFYNNKSTARDTRSPFLRWVLR